MFNNTKYKVSKILRLLGGLPEECDWIDYKELRNKMDGKYMEKMKTLVVSFLNSLREFDKDKYIIFGVKENKKTKEKILTGINPKDFPDDNEWQNLFASIRPNHPYVETGTFDEKGLLFAYIYISAKNYKVPYSCKKEGAEIFYIRRGGNKYASMTNEEKKELEEMKTEINKFGKVYPKSDILNKLVLIGKYNESNKADIRLLETITGRPYENIKSYCLMLDNSFSEEEQSIYGFGCSKMVEVQNKKERLMQFTADELSHANEIISSIFTSKENYSEELLCGIVDTLAFLKNNGFIFIAENIIKETINFNSIRDPKYRNILQSIAGVSPVYMLNLIVENKNKILELDNKHLIIEILRVIVWFPEHYTEAGKLLFELGDREIHEVFSITETGTAASFEQKKELIQEIAYHDRTAVFEMLNRILCFNPKSPSMFLSHNCTPQIYKRFFEGSHSFDFMKLQDYYAIMLECAGNSVEKLLKLLPHWLQPFPFSNLNSFVEHLENVEPTIQQNDDRLKLWNRLCNTPLIYITDVPVEDVLKNRLISIGNKFMPDDIYEQYQQWFREGVITDLSLDGTKYEDVCKRVFEEQKSILLRIYKKSGISEMVDFIRSINIDSNKLTQMLISEEFSLNIDDDNALLSAFFDSPETYSSYLHNKSYNNKNEWIKNIRIDDLDSKDRARLFSVFYPTIDNIGYFEEILGDEIRLYWESFAFKELDDASALQYVFKKLIDFGVPQKAFDLIHGLQICIRQLSPKWIFDVLISIEKYQQCSIPKYNFAIIYSYLNGKIDDDKMEELENLSFRLYGKIQYNYEDFKPRVTFKRIVNEAEFFIEVVENIVNDPMGLCEHLLIHCDDEPNIPYDWVASINNIVADESNESKDRVEYWIGHILYNTMKCVDDNYVIEDLVAGLLEKSDKKRDGFCHHAYFPNGVHSNGSYEEDFEHRINAKKFRNLAIVQAEKGNIEFGKALEMLTDSLINSVDSEIY